MTSTYEEFMGSPSEQFSDGSGSTAERLFLVDWSSRITFASNLCNKAFPEFNDCRVKQISIEPFSKEIPPSGDVNDLETDIVSYVQNSGKVALVRASYAPSFANKTWPTDTPKPFIRADTELRLRMRFSGQFLTLPGRLMAWEDSYASGDNPMPGDANSRLLIPISEMNLQWDYVDDPPIDDLRALIGSVNQGLFLNCPAETVLFEGFDMDDSFRCDPNNMHTNRLNLTLRQRIINYNGSTYGWNHDYREKPSGFVKVVTNEGIPRYAVESWALMFA